MSFLGGVVAGLRPVLFLSAVGAPQTLFVLHAVLCVAPTLIVIPNPVAFARRKGALKVDANGGEGSASTRSSTNSVSPELSTSQKYQGCGILGVLTRLSILLETNGLGMYYVLT